MLEPPARRRLNATPGSSSKRRSLEGLHGTVNVPAPSARPWRPYLAFAGPAMLVSVGYMDPGNWSTDLSAGAGCRDGLLWAVGVSSPMAICVRVVSARLG